MPVDKVDFCLKTTRPHKHLITLTIVLWPSSLFSPMREFVECGESSPHGSESGDEPPHSTLGGLNDDQGQFYHHSANFTGLSI